MEPNRQRAQGLAILVAVEALVRTHPNGDALRKAIDAAYAGGQLVAAQKGMDEPTRNLLRELVATWKAIAP